MIEIGLSKGRWTAGVDVEGGGTLVSLGLDGQEIMYSAERAGHEGGWGGGAPWLWPAVGRTLMERDIAEAEAAGVMAEDGHYVLDGVERPMPIHGFAMRKAWQPCDEGESGTRCWFACELEEDEETLEIYPFLFRLESRTTVYRSYLTHELSVEAKAGNREPMPFTVGNHITLDIRAFLGRGLDEALMRTDCSVRYGLTSSALLDGTEEALKVRDVPLAEMNDRVVGGYASPEPWVDLYAEDARVRISQAVVSGACAPESMIYVFYGDEEREFFCPEPWIGPPNALNSGEGLVRLAPGGSLVWRLSLHHLSSAYLAE